LTAGTRPSSADPTILRIHRTSSSDLARDHLVVPWQRWSSYLLFTRPVASPSEQTAQLDRRSRTVVAKHRHSPILQADQVASAFSDNQRKLQKNTHELGRASHPATRQVLATLPLCPYTIAAGVHAPISQPRTLPNAAMGQVFSIAAAKRELEEIREELERERADHAATKQALEGLHSAVDSIIASESPQQSFTTSNIHSIDIAPSSAELNMPQHDPKFEYIGDGKMRFTWGDRPQDSYDFGFQDPLYKYIARHHDRAPVTAIDNGISHRVQQNWLRIKNAPLVKYNHDSN
ncbi:hypothetical protein KCU74_g387, partial [Aureobasidium melanogenum]